jgi:hypothetical protein
MRVRQALFLVGGRGTRLGSIAAGLRGLRFSGGRLSRFTGAALVQAASEGLAVSSAHG